MNRRGVQPAESQRLRKRSIPVEPAELAPDLGQHLSGIDGTVLVDRTGTCHAIGVILDGRATDRGDQARGSRYNSVVMYMESVDVSTVCLVISEDGYVDLFPRLRPQIRRSEIDDRIDLLKTQNINNYHRTRNWLDSLFPAE